MSAPGVLANDIDVDGRVLEFNEQFVRMWDIPLSVMAARVHRPIQQAAASQVSDPKTFLARINEI